MNTEFYVKTAQGGKWVTLLPQDRIAATALQISEQDYAKFKLAAHENQIQWSDAPVAYNSPTKDDVDYYKAITENT